jgi:hypothetical protein
MCDFNVVKQRIDDLTKNSTAASAEIEFSHSQSVLSWVLRLKPDADSALRIAALGHDVDRSFGVRVQRSDFDSYDEFKKHHALRSAKIIVALLTELRCSDDVIKKTKYLIEHHEVGGQGDADVLKDADSLSFFDNNVEIYLQLYPRDFGKKVVFMYERLSSHAKSLISSINFKSKEMERIVKNIIQELES